MKKIIIWVVLIIVALWLYAAISIGNAFSEKTHIKSNEPSKNDLKTQ